MTPVRIRLTATCAHNTSNGHSWYMVRWSFFLGVNIVIIQSPQARKPLDRMCVHAGDGQTYLVGVDSMS